MGLLFGADQENRGVGISDRGHYKKSVFLWYSIFDPSADPAESHLETGDTDEAGSPRQFPVSGAS